MERMVVIHTVTVMICDSGDAGVAEGGTHLHPSSRGCIPFPEVLRNVQGKLHFLTDLGMG